MSSRGVPPMIVPDTIVIDGGRVFISDTFTRPPGATEHHEHHLEHDVILTELGGVAACAAR